MNSEDTKIKAGTWEALLEDVKVRLDKLISHMKESGTQCERVSNLMTLVRHVKEKHPKLPLPCIELVSNVDYAMATWTIGRRKKLRVNVGSIVFIKLVDARQRTTFSSWAGDDTATAKAFIDKCLAT